MNAPQTLPELFFNAIEKFGTKEAALRYKEDGIWKGITHQELAKRVKHVALGLKELGFQPGDHVVFARMDRAFRNLRDLLTVLDEYEKREIVVHFVDQRLDLSTANGKLVASILAAIAQWESDRKSEASRAVHAKLRHPQGSGSKLGFLDGRFLAPGLGLTVEVYQQEMPGNVEHRRHPPRPRWNRILGDYGRFRHCPSVE